MNDKQPLFAAGLLLGIGLGGFFDGIVFHQILQVHNMLSNIFFPNTIRNLEINMFWDGLFHAFTWISTVIGIFLLWQGLNNKEIYSGKHFIGLLLLGWGLFNIIEGTIDHLILKLHHVIQRTSLAGQFYSDISFLVSGIVLGLIGLIIIRRNKQIP
ncbi:Predicted membrane protein [Legionella busanensis]|uniref:Predicted membrane protein n=1 Tax=Legionella busanensis TaxID=190655 RepID=A0A378JV78_9GAMM|nr:DUF2243 domain-containing protein [Legionella busanensis]STX52112.1 Predicted membrane protein [Legionella busanensis]